MATSNPARLHRLGRRFLRRLLTTAVVLGGVGVWLPVAAQAAAPTITTLSPSSAPVGTPVTITGTNFTGATAVRFNGVSVGSSFKVRNATTITTSVPALATSGLVTVATAGGTATSPTPFTVTLGIFIKGAVGPPASTVTIYGSGFAANEFVDIYFDTTDLVLVTTDASGNFSNGALTVPADATPGTHWISAGGRRSQLAAQSQFLVRTDWPQFRDTANHKGLDKTENQLNPETVSGLDQAWTAPSGSGIGTSSPAIVNGVAYIGSDGGKLSAFNATTGVKVWDSAGTIGGSVYSSPSVVNGVVYIGADDAKLYAFNATTGAELWDTGKVMTGPIDSSPTVASGVVYVGSGDGKLYAFNATTGAEVWDTGSTIGGAIGLSSPAVANGVVFVGAHDDKLYAFDATTGAELWDTGATMTALVDSSPAVANGVVYVASEDAKLYAFNTATGAELWDTGSAISELMQSSPAVANGVVYVGSYDHRLYAFNAHTGAELWDTGTTTQGAVISSPEVANGVVYVGSSDGNVYAFDTFGDPLWVGTTGDAVESSPAIADGVVYAGSYDGRLYAWNLVSAGARISTARPKLSALHPNVGLRSQPSSRAALRGAAGRDLHAR